MPMDRPFKQRYEPGDLVYGTTDARPKYINAWGLDERVVPYPTIDCYSLTEEEARRRNLPGPKHPISPLQRSFWTHLSSHSKYSQALRYKDELKEKHSRSDYSFEETRWKIKGGLYWSSRDDRNLTVHFILDGLDMRAIAEKCSTWEGRALDCIEGGVKYRAYTGVELRWIYRNQSDALVRRTVQFWRNFRPVAPPWEQGHLWWRGARIWSRYVPRAWQK